MKIFTFVLKNQLSFEIFRKFTIFLREISMENWFRSFNQVYGKIYSFIQPLKITIFFYNNFSCWAYFPFSSYWRSVSLKQSSSLRRMLVWVNCVGVNGLLRIPLSIRISACIVSEFEPADEPPRAAYLALVASENPDLHKFRSHLNPISGVRCLFFSSNFFFPTITSPYIFLHKHGDVSRATL